MDNLKYQSSLKNLKYITQKSEKYNKKYTVGGHP